MKMRWEGRGGMLCAWDRIEMIPGFDWKTRSKETF